MSALNFKVNGEEIVVDIGSLTIAERQQSKKVLATLIEPDEIDVVAVALWLTLKRTKPDTTWDEVAESFTFDHIAGARVADETDGLDPLS